MSRQKTCTVGLTGGLASGKSSVAQMLRERGAEVLDADVIVAELYKAGAAGAEALRQSLGKRVLDQDGAVDKTALVALIAAEAGALETVNRTIHPLVYEEIARWLSGVTSPLAVVEAALMVETGSYRRYDHLLVVSCTRHQQVERALARGMDQRRIETLLSKQASLAQKCAVADLVIDNSGSQETLSAEVDRAWTWLNEHCS